MEIRGIPIVDLRTRQGETLFTARSQRCGVKCKACNWTGYRIARYYFSLSCAPDYITQNQAVKGIRSRPCPNCGGNTIFTHLAS